MKKSLVAVIAAGAGVLALAAPGSAAPKESGPASHDGCWTVTVGATKAKSSTITVDGEGGHVVVLPSKVSSAGKAGANKGRAIAKGVQQSECVTDTAPSDEVPTRGGVPVDDTTPSY